MKTTFLLTVGIAVFLLTRSFCAAQATVQFANTTDTRITNCLTRAPQSNAALVQLYFTPDLSAVSNQSVSALMLPAGVSRPVPGIASLAFHGRFYGGTLTLPGVAAGAQVVVKVKMWPTNYPSFEQAAANGGDVAESLSWVQTTGGGPIPPPMIGRWGFRPFLFPQCEPLLVPLALQRVNATTIRMDWPVGTPPNLQVNDGSTNGWQPLTSGTFVQDHWEFQLSPTNGVQFFRLAQ